MSNKILLRKLFGSPTLICHYLFDLKENYLQRNSPSSRWGTSKKKCHLRQFFVFIWDILCNKGWNFQWPCWNITKKNPEMDGVEEFLNRFSRAYCIQYIIIEYIYKWQRFVSNVKSPGRKPLIIVVSYGLYPCSSIGTMITLLITYPAK